LDSFLPLFLIILLQRIVWVQFLRLNVIKRQLLALEHQADKIVELVMQVNHLIFDDVPVASPVLLNFAEPLVVQGLFEAFSGLVQSLLEPAYVLLARHILSIFIARLQETVASLACRIEAESALDEVDGALVFLHFLDGVRLRLSHHEPVCDYCNQQ